MQHSEEGPDQTVTRRGVPPDRHPDDPGGFLQIFVNCGVPAILSLWDLQPDRRPELLDKWCKFAKTEAWAREEARALLYRLLLRGETPTPELYEVIDFRPLRPMSGQRKMRGPDHRLKSIVKALEEEGFTKREVSRIYATSRPGGKKPFDRTTLGKRLERVGEVPDGEGIGHGRAVHRYDHPRDRGMKLSRLHADGCSTDLSLFIQELLNTHEGRALELLWDGEPEKHPNFVENWSERTRYQGAMWDEVRRFVDDKIRRRQPVPKRLLEAVSRIRPCSKRDPRYFERDMLWQAIVVTVRRMGHTDAKRRLLDEVCKSRVIGNSTFDSALRRGREYVYNSPPLQRPSQPERQQHVSTPAATSTVALTSDNSELPMGLIFPVKDWSEVIFGVPALRFFKELGADGRLYANRPWVICDVSSLDGFEDIGPDARLWIRWGGIKYVDGANTWLEFATKCESDSDGAALKPVARSRSLDPRAAWKWYAILGIQPIVNVFFVEHRNPKGDTMRCRHYFAYIEDPYYLVNTIFRDGIELVRCGQAGPRMGPCTEIREGS